jgi:hypothetical protein
MMSQYLNVAGPANRGPLLQQLANNAAQNVMRKQRMRALLQQSAHSAGSQAAAGVGVHSSMRAHPMGVRSQTFQPYAGMAGGATAGALGALVSQQQDVGGGGNGGGYDFASLPHPSGPTVSTSPNLTPQPPGLATGWNPSFDPQGNYIGSGPGPQPPDQAQPGGTMQVSNGLIPLGNGMFYDPINDAIRGGGAVVAAQGGNNLNPVDRKF